METVSRRTDLEVEPATLESIFTNRDVRVEAGIPPHLNYAESKKAKAPS